MLYIRENQDFHFREKTSNANNLKEIKNFCSIPERVRSSPSKVNIVRHEKEFRKDTLYSKMFH